MAYWLRTALTQIGEAILIVGCVPIVVAFLLYKTLITPFLWPLLFTIYLRGNVRDAWRRCLPLWIRQGSIDDYDPDEKGSLRTFYDPSFATTLARRFASKFCDHHGFIESRTKWKNESKFAKRMVKWMADERRRRGRLAKPL
jgi:hypothetical protein